MFDTFYLILFLYRSFKQKREQKHSLSQIDESDILKEPLKDTSSTNASLTRSYSSPNLVQVKKNT